MQQHRHPPATDPGRLGPTEGFLEPDREHRRGRVGVVDPDPRTAGHRDPLRRQVVQPPASAQGSSRRSAPSTSTRARSARRRTGQQRLVGDVGPVVAERVPAEGQPLTQRPGRRGPGQQVEPGVAQSGQQRGGDLVRVGPGQGTVDQPDGTQPEHLPRHHVPAGPADLPFAAQQRAGRRAGGPLVEDGGQPDPGGRCAGSAVGHRDGQPVDTHQPRPGCQLRCGSATHQVRRTTRPPHPGQPFRVRQPNQQPGGQLVGQPPRLVWPLRSTGRTRRKGGAQPAHLRAPAGGGGRVGAGAQPTPGGAEIVAGTGHGRLAEQRHHPAPHDRHRRDRPVEQCPGQPGMRADRDDGPPPLGDPAVRVDRTEGGERFVRHRHRRRRGRVRQRETARPARWVAAARETGTVTSAPSPRARSNRATRDRPASTTVRTPGTVRLLSATAVASTTRRRSPTRRARPGRPRSADRAGGARPRGRPGRPAGRRRRRSRPRRAGRPTGRPPARAGPAGRWRRRGRAVPGPPGRRRPRAVAVAPIRGSPDAVPTRPAPPVPAPCHRAGRRSGPPPGSPTWPAATAPAAGWPGTRR